MMRSEFRWVGVLGALLALSVTGAGCGATFSVAVDNAGDGFLLVVERPEECFQQDLIEEDCFAEETVVTYCEEDIFGFLDCFDEVIFEIFCEDVIVDSFLVCE